MTLTLADAKATTQADAKGQWLVELPARKAGENLELSIVGTKTIVLKNVILGDIWLCGGQSNMEMFLGSCLGAGDDIKGANLPTIRRIKFNHVQAPYPEADAPAVAAWQVCSTQTAAGFTAAGFYFAREIQAKTGVPIGLLDDNWGGTQIEPWVPSEGLALIPDLHDAVVANASALVAYTAQLPKNLEVIEQWIAATRLALTNKDTILPAMPPMPAHPRATGWCSMYNAMIAPLTRSPIKGVIWYQGEANGSEGDSYFTKMQALIGGWRKVWNLGDPATGAGHDFPFYFVQLASFQGVSENPAGGEGWAKLRAAQTKALSIPNTGMAVIIDTVPLKESNDIHPKNKYDVGMRLARWALNRDYGQKDCVPSGPIFKEMKIEDGKARLSFDFTGSGLMVASKEGRSAAVEEKTGKLKRFAIAGADKKWFWAEAVIDQNTLVVSSPDVKAPVAVRYAFAMNPDGANLYNREGLPASPFRTDAW